MKPSSDHMNDEIDLVELLQNLWSGKWLIAGMSTAALAVGSAYVALTPNTFDASITFRPVDTATIYEFDSLNRAMGLDYVSTAGAEPEDSNAPQPKFLSAHSALAEFVEVLLQRDTISQAANQSQIFVFNSGAGATYEEQLRSYAFEVDISPIEIVTPSITGSWNTGTAWRLTWEGVDEVASARFISDILSLTNEATVQRLRHRVVAEAEFIRQENSRRIQKIETEIANAIEDYRVRLSDQLAYLSEQATLARVLEIGTGNIGAGNSNLAAQSSDASGSSAMSYLDGYMALDEQITILSSRDQVEAFVPGLRDLQAELRALQQDRRADELIAAMEVTSLADAGTFRAAQYDLAAIEMTHHRKTLLILALSLVLGGFVGAVTVLIRNAVNERRGRQKPTRLQH